MTTLPRRRRKPYGVAWYERLVERLQIIGTSAPVYLDQADAFLRMEIPTDPQEHALFERAQRICSELRSALMERERPTLVRGQRVWLAGHNPVSDGAGQFERQIEVLAAVPIPPPAIALHFREAGYKRRGHFFDMESLGYVVLAAWRHNLAARGVFNEDLYRPTSIWLTMTKMDDRGEGVEIAHEPPVSPAPATVAVDLLIANPPTQSARGRIIPELIGRTELSESPWLGLELAFGPEVDIGEFGFYGPIKPLIDAMSPLLGRDSGGGPADHRLHDLRIRSDGAPDGGVRVRFWYCKDGPRVGYQAVPDGFSSPTAMLE